MSLPIEKLRSIFKIKDLIFALSISKKCKIPDEWRREIRSATKHAPWRTDKITIDGEKFDYEPHTSVYQVMEYVRFIDESCKKKPKKTPNEV